MAHPSVSARLKTSLDELRMQVLGAQVLFGLSLVLGLWYGVPLGLRFQRRT